MTEINDSIRYLFMVRNHPIIPWYGGFVYPRDELKRAIRQARRMRKRDDNNPNACPDCDATDYDEERGCHNCLIQQADFMEPEYHD